MGCMLAMSNGLMRQPLHAFIKPCTLMLPYRVSAKALFAPTLQAKTALIICSSLMLQISEIHQTIS